MISKITLSNFQKHHHLEVKLGRGVTTLVGPTSAGKSTILRAFRWVALNQGSHPNLWGEDRCTVVVVVDEHNVVRRRTNKGNSYRIDGKVYKAPKKSVPDEVDHLLNIGEVNFQGQLDKPFWFMETAGQVSRELNSIINLGVIDNTLSKIAAELRKARERLELIEERRIDARQRAKSLKWIVAFERCVTRLEQKAKKIEQQRTNCARLSKLIEEMEKAKAKIKEIPSTRKMDRLLSRIKEERNKVKKLEDLLGQIDRLKEELCASERGRMRLEKELGKIESCPICGNPMKE